jgi:hypothetical protein
MTVRDVKNAVARVTADGVLDRADAQEIIDAAAKKVGDKELAAIAEAVSSSAYRVDNDAFELTMSVIEDIANAKTFAEQANLRVKAEAPRLAAEEEARLAPGEATTSLGGTPIPEAVKDVVRAARAGGATVYDVREVEGAERDDERGGFHVPGLWSPYPQEANAVSNLAFEETEVTPAKLLADMQTEQTFSVFKGFVEETFTDPRSGKVREMKTAQYEEVTRRGSGSIGDYDGEGNHDVPFGRSPNGDRWASNFAFLSDGSMHALPWSRHNPAHKGVILTNPSLARGQRMMFNGHIKIEQGKVTYVGMSGRLQKHAARGDARFIDPLALLKAWGFELADGLQLTLEGKHGPLENRGGLLGNDKSAEPAQKPAQEPAPKPATTAPTGTDPVT